MTIYFAASTMGFYHSDIHTQENIPADAVEITQESYDALMVAQSEGRTIVAGSGGVPVAEALTATPPIAEVFQVTNRQARLALLEAGKLADVEAAIDAMPEPQKTRFRIEWDTSANFERTSPTVAAIAQAIGLSDAQLDELFRAAILL